MNFIEAVIKISKRKDLELCDSIDELEGKDNICVYFKNGEFIGSLNWPRIKEDNTIEPANVDYIVKAVLERKLTEKEFNKRFPFKKNE